MPRPPVPIFGILPLGIERGKSFDIDRLQPAIRSALMSAPEEAQKLMAW